MAEYQALTGRQRAILNFLRRFAAERGFPPTVREVAGRFSLNHQTAAQHLAALERKGYIRRRSSKARDMEIAGAPAAESAEVLEVPLVGRVAAGTPLLAPENVEGTLALPATMSRSGDLFALRVTGDSMIEAHIAPGDILLVRKQPTAESGAIVVARIGDETTVKRLRRRAAEVLLVAENPAMPPISVRPEDLIIEGVVVGLYRVL